ncbi:MAG TPA: YegS/Rv2252/BmrU family lipid kinase [Sphingobacteriaceae bacterium]
MKRKLLYIVNPISGVNDKGALKKIIEKETRNAGFAYGIYPSVQGGDYAHLYPIIKTEKYTDVIIAGGDGTINQAIHSLRDQHVQFGIIPCGSGNGLARALKIRLGRRDAVRTLNRLQTVKIDTGAFNGHSFYNMAGIGFDAHISSCFAGIAKRGFQGYVKTAFTEITRYEPESYVIDIDGHRIERTAFMISLANSSQFGNNAHVAPKASLRDGLLDVCIIKPFPLYHFPVMGLHMFTRTADRSRYVEIIKGRDIRITRTHPGAVHVDGEPITMGSELEVTVKPLNLEVLI